MLYSSIMYFNESIALSNPYPSQMTAARPLKRKGDESSGISKKRSHHPSPSPVENDADFEDIEGESSKNAEEVAGYDIYDDPMIDRQASGESDEDEDGEEGEEGGSNKRPLSAQATAGPSKQHPKGLYAPPTLDELDRLHAAESRGGTSFALQLEALLSSTLLSTTPHPGLKKLLATIHSQILSLPSLPPLEPKAAVSRLGKASHIPFPGPNEFNPLKAVEVNWKLGWEKPEEVFVGGSWSVCGGYKKGKGVQGSVDVVVVMPSELFSPKDRMSYRYFHKRAHYLAVIAASFRGTAKKEGSMHAVEVTWDTSVDPRRPVVVLSAGKAQGSKYALDIRIHAAIPQSVFAPNTLAPSKSLLWHPSVSEDASTPLYSTSILHDTLHSAHLHQLRRLSQTCTPARSVDSFLAVWRTWCSRRGISRERGGSGWFAATLLTWVVDGAEVGGVGGARDKVRRVRGLGRTLGHWGALRAAWELLAHGDFVKSPVFLSASGDPAIPYREFVSAYQHVLVDVTGSINVFAGWEQGEVQLLQLHARETLAMLEDTSVDRFGDVLLRDTKLGTAVFDECIHVDITTSKLPHDLLASSERLSRADALSTSTATILRQGLSTRVRLVHVTPVSETILSVGIVYDPTQATRILDIGPSTEQAVETDAFRKLWGEKAELRRFKDGSIAESVVWDVPRPEDAVTIPSQIVMWLLSRHFSIPETAVSCLSSQQDWRKVIQVPDSARNAISVAGSEKLGFRPLLDGYDSLYKLLKSIDDELPLSILHVTPASELLRYSSTFVPHPIDVNRFPSAPDALKWFPAAEIVLQFESSPRWPDDLAAIQKVKLALIDKVARVLMAQIRGLKAGIVFESGRSDIEDQAALEVTLPQGVAFLIRIFHVREKTLLERIVYDDTPEYGTSLPKPARKLALPALSHHIRRFQHLPQHHASIAPLHHRYPSYSSATRLLKRWIAAHMLSTHVPVEVIELIMAHVYLDPGSLPTPASATTGFVRSINLLASWEWRKEALLVPVYSATRDAASSSGRHRFPAEKRKNVESNFEALRKRDGELSRGAWVIGTEEDAEGLRWTERTPSKVVAGRVTVLAKATVAAINAGTETGMLNVRGLFVTPLEHYDVLINLHPRLVTRYAQGVRSDSEVWEQAARFRNIQEGRYGELVRIGFDPAGAFVDDIRRIYGDTILVFHDLHGGTTIGLLFNPSKDVPRTFKPLLGYSTRPTDGSAALVALDRKGVVAEIERLGKGLIESVEVRV
ncbi:Nrap protein [Naematelia encephala]|uniref:U3 small nucleolar RNA-associated protein 22 n=1 Tax=Naematelia encephala TaxID=71784 RepID=A0A1Y2B091_9TREE|nr:Nrap protein [Naematelia encephala]